MKFRISLMLLATIILMSSFMGELPFNGLLNLNNLFGYVIEDLPPRAEYRWNDINPITDEGSTLGRVLFYDKKLSVNSSVACASCHQQAHAFGDPRKVSIGFDGQPTERHAMRLINVDFHADNRKFWDERVSRLEKTTTLPFQNAIEMGFSGEDGSPDIDSLIRRMQGIDYYPALFQTVYGDREITEEKMALALAQFIRSINTFDSRFDEGFMEVGEEITHFPNFTDAENRGKRMFFNPPIGIFDGERPTVFGAGAGCGFCHKAPGMDLIHLSTNNGVIGVAGDTSKIDLSVIRSPSLKNLTKPDGSENGPFMHDGSLETLMDVVNHYDSIPFDTRNPLTSTLLFPLSNGNVELRLSNDEKEDLVSFLKTLAGTDIYTNEKWSNPFDEGGNLTLLGAPDPEVIEEMEVDSVRNDTLIQDTSIFSEYTWLDGVIDRETCTTQKVEVYDLGSYAFFFLYTEESTFMYYEDGTFYCNQTDTYSCKEAYGLLEPTAVWECDDTNLHNNESIISKNRDIVTSKLQLKAYPNPNNGLFQVAIDKDHTTDLQIEIFDISGKKIYQASLNAKNHNNVVTIDIQDNLPGLYLVRVTMNEETIIEKVIVE